LLPVAWRHMSLNCSPTFTCTFLLRKTKGRNP
jgi:hypothetical protein